MFPGVGRDQVCSHPAEGDRRAERGGRTDLLLRGEREAYRRRPCVRQPRRVGAPAQGQRSCVPAS